MKNIWALSLMGLMAAGTVQAEVPADLVEPLKACTSCHEENGNGVKPNYPFLNWQEAKYLEDQMVGFQNGEQPTGVPKHIPKSLTRPQLKAMAAYYASQKPPREKQPFDAAKADIGKPLFQERCMDCHMDNGRQSDKDAPILAGQPAEYLFTQEKWYMSGKRKYSHKADEAHKGLDEAQREAVAHFLASQEVNVPQKKGRRRGG